MNLLHRILRKSATRGLLAISTLAIVSACTIALAASAAVAAPTIDGNLTDFIAYGDQLRTSGTGVGLAITDKADGQGNPIPENLYSDTKFIPCPTVNGQAPPVGTHWVNGFEIFYHYLDYVPGSGQLYLALRSEGFIGDTDGDNDPNGFGNPAASCNPEDNIDDATGIAAIDLYAWRFDLNCDGTVDASIVVQDNKVTGEGLFAGATGSIAFAQNGGTGATGHDLEVSVNLPAPYNTQGLPAAFDFVRVESNAFDGLSEDRSDGVPIVGTPGIDVLKSANPTSVCPGGTTKFTITIQNTGATPLSVVATDQLPAQLTYAGNLSGTCNPQVATNVNGLITFQPININAGASCTITFDVTASQECFGSVTNRVDVVGTFSSNCIDNPDHSASVTDFAEATVLCKAKPCVEVQINCPELVCTGKPYDVTATAKNCSVDVENITIVIDGQSFTHNNVAAGASVSSKRTYTMGACTEAGESHSATASGTNDCGTANAGPANCTTHCAPNACLEFTFECTPSACAGAPIELKGTAKNCSTGPETITITIDGTQYVIADVPAGQTVTRTKSLNMPQCTPGQPINFNASAVASNSCNTTEPINRNCAVQCLAGPCVDITANPDNPACAGSKVILSGKATNCGSGLETIVIKYNGSAVKTCQDVAPGGECTYSIEVTMPACTGGTKPFVVSAEATAACGTISDEVTHNVPCQSPQIDIEKTAQEQSIPNLGTIHYTITLKNPSSTVTLENIVITDHLCSYAKYNNNASPAPFSAPNVGSGGDVVWHVAELAPNGTLTFTFEVIGDVAFGGGACPGTFNCPNHVEAIGYCKGSNGQSSAQDQDDITTPIVCAGEACPRTPGFWTQQCLQRSNGATKFTKTQVTSIASCIDDASSFFNWSNDFDSFCAIVNPATMDQRVQAKRQFATLLANYCTDQLNLQPSQGGTIFLPGDTQVHCSGFNATTISQLIAEVDALLAQLEGQNLSDGAVKAKYGSIISCIDDINNGRTIATRADCEETSGTASRNGVQTNAPGDASVSVELYKPMPNPFSGATTFAYRVDADASVTEISVFDVAGRQVRKLVSGVQAAGVHTVTWDGRNDQGAQVQRGVYFVRTMIAVRKEATNRVLYLTEGQ